jgi:hypothetical protein
MHTHDHADFIKGFYEEQQEIFDVSSQGMYAFLDDHSRVCNSKFATMLGYASPEEWASVDTKGSFPDAFVAEKSQQKLVEAFQNVMENSVSATFSVSWKKKSGGTVDTTVVLVPIQYQGHTIALHFVSQK